eukprot:464130-Hanusia_phi.AAC.3
MTVTGSTMRSVPSSSFFSSPPLTVALAPCVQHRRASPPREGGVSRRSQLKLRRARQDLPARERHVVLQWGAEDGSLPQDKFQEEAFSLRLRPGERRGREEDEKDELEDNRGRTEEPRDRDEHATRAEGQKDSAAAQEGRDARGAAGKRQEREEANDGAQGPEAKEAVAVGG